MNESGEISGVFIPQQLSKVCY